MFHLIGSNLIGVFIGLIVITTCLINLFEFKISPSFLLRPLFSIFYGLIAGILGGISTIMGPPIVAYLASLNLPKNTFAEIVSLFVFLCLIPFYFIFFLYQSVSLNDLFVSALGLVPAVVMQSLGFKIRNLVPQERFKKGVFTALIIIGLLILYKNLF